MDRSSLVQIHEEIVEDESSVFSANAKTIKKESGITSINLSQDTTNSFDKLSVIERKELVLRRHADRRINLKLCAELMQNFVAVVENDEVKKFEELIKDLDDDQMRITDIMTTDGLTLLHAVTNKNAQKCFNTLLLEIKQRYQHAAYFESTLVAYIN